MESKTTLKDLSKILNLSVSTISKSLNDSKEISLITKKRVKELAVLNHYIPNTCARNLKLKNTKTIGVIIPSVQSHFFAKALEGIVSKGGELGYRVTIAISNEQIDKETESIDSFLKSQVDGIILSLSQETETSLKLDHLKRIEDFKVPIVLFDRTVENFNCDKISINDTLHSELAVDDLFKSGCKNILYLSGIPGTSVNHSRKKGYLETIKKNDSLSQIIEYKHPDFPSNQILELVKNKLIDGLLASDELSAILAMKCILKAGFKIPENVSVIGFTNGTMGEHFIPSLSSIDQKAKEQGELAIETIIDRIEGKLPENPMEYKLDASIIHRESTMNLIKSISSSPAI